MPVTSQHPLKVGTPGSCLAGLTVSLAIGKNVAKC